MSDTSNNASDEDTVILTKTEFERMRAAAQAEDETQPLREPTWWEKRQAQGIKLVGNVLLSMAKTLAFFFVMLLLLWYWTKLMVNDQLNVPGEVISFVIAITVVGVIGILIWGTRNIVLGGIVCAVVIGLLSSVPVHHYLSGVGTGDYRYSWAVAGPRYAFYGVVAVCAGMAAAQLALIDSDLSERFGRFEPWMAAIPPLVVISLLAETVQNGDHNTMLLVLTVAAMVVSSVIGSQRAERAKTETTSTTTEVEEKADDHPAPEHAS